MRIIMFHDVRNAEDEIFGGRYGICGLLSIDSFERKIAYLKNNYRIISLHEYINKYREMDEHEELCILTFDDGLSDHYNNVYPILKKYNLRGTFFISAYPMLKKKVLGVHKIQYIIHSNVDRHVILKDTLELLDNLSYLQNQQLWCKDSISKYKNNTWSSIDIFLTNVLRDVKNEKIVDTLFDRYILEHLKVSEADFSDKFYLNKHQIKEMHNNNMEFGCHGYYHNLNDNEETIGKTLSFLKDIGIDDCCSHSYPNGITNKDVIDRLNLSVALTTENREAKPDDDLLLLPRMNCCAVKEDSCGIVVCGIQQQGIDICKFLTNNNIKISCIVTITKEQSITNKASGWVDYSTYCKEHDVPIYYCNTYSLKSEQDVRFFKKNNFGLLLLGGWQRLIPSDILSALKFGGIGQHGSSELLPKCRGRSPLNWSIILNRKRLIWNIFFMTPGIDDGKIIDSRKVEINEWDDCNTLYYKVSIIVKNMYLENIPKILSNQIKTTSQIGEPTFYEKRTIDDGLIDWNKSVNDLFNLIRGVTFPYPGAFTYNGLSKILVWKAQPFDNNIYYPNAKNGEIVEIFKDSFVVNCCDGLLLVTEHDAENICIKDVLNIKIT